MSAPRIVPLSAIVGRSLFNVRPDGDPDGRAAMAASIAAVGQLQALIVRPAQDMRELYEIDDGGCRWDAMRLLVERDALEPPEDREPWTWNTDVQILVVEGDAGVARERSLAANVIRRQLHPVEECEAFAAMVADGLSAEAIAADFGQTTRYVRQRLKLDTLSPRARAAWRAGTLSAEAAGVLTGAADHAAQDAILERFREGAALVNYNLEGLRHELRQKAVRGDAPQARYVGIDAYLAAGGAVDEQLFDTAPLFLDAPLLKRLASQKLVALGQRVADRFGFGSVILSDDLPEGEEGWRWGHLVEQTDAEDAELDRLDDEQAEQQRGCGALMCEAIADEFDELREAVMARAIERCTTPAQRAGSAVFVSLNGAGRPIVEPGRTRPEALAKAKVERDPPPVRPFAATAAPKTLAQVFSGDAAPDARPPGKALVQVMDEAMTRGYAALVAARPYLAMVLATAALTARRNGSAVRFRGCAGMVRVGGIDVESEESRRQRPDDFATAAAVALAGARGRDDVMARFAAAVALSIDVAPASSLDGGRHGLVDAAALAELLSHYAPDDYEEQLAAALDYDAYFAAAAKEPTLDAIRQVDGLPAVAHARGLSRADRAAYAAEVCRARQWLPAELRAPNVDAMRSAIDTKLPRQMPALADAMAEALAADGEDLGAEPFVFDPQTPAEAIDAFLAQHALRDDERCRIKAQDAFEAFQARMPPGVRDLLPTMSAFGRAIEAAGIGKKRLKTGWHYLGLDLRPAPALKYAAE